MPLKNHTGWGFQVIDSPENGFKTLNEHQLKRLHGLFCEALRKLIAFFEENNITWFLVGGSALGAVRHKGFIPWDDDMDISIPRKDYDRCIRLFKNSGLEKDFRLTGPGCEIGDEGHILRFYIKESAWKVLFRPCNEIPIDVFPLESVPKAHWKMFFRVGLAFLLERIGSCTLFFEQRKQPDVAAYLSKTNPHNRHCYQLNAFLGFFFAFLSAKQWLKIYDRCMADASPSEFASIPFGRNEYLREKHPVSVFLPASKGTFEGITVNLPHDPDTYLSALYGADYMTVPPESKRETHRPLFFSIPPHLSKNGD